MRKNKTNGITLIALVITIIIILILAGIVITTIGDNGILGQSEKAKREKIVGEKIEEVKMAILSVVIDKMRR